MMGSNLIMNDYDRQGKDAIWNVAMARIMIMEELSDKIKNLIGHYILGENK